MKQKEAVKESNEASESIYVIEPLQKDATKVQSFENVLFRVFFYYLLWNLKNYKTLEKNW